MTATLPERFTFDEWASIVSDPTKDKTYLDTQLGGVVGQYLSWKATEGRAAPATIREYEPPLAALCLMTAHKTPAEITVQDLRAVRDTFVPSRHKAVTAAFRGCFQWLYEEGMIDSSPAGRLRAPKQREKPITDLFTDEEKSRIVTAQTDPMDRAGVLLFFRGGLRKAELRNLRVRDVNMVERYVLVTRGKGDKYRRVPIAGATIRALDEMMMTDVPGLGRPRLPDEFLLAPWKTRHKTIRAPGRRMSNHAAHDWWYGCLQRAGVVSDGATSGRRMHSSRHTYATDLGRATNWNMLAVQKNLGHKNIATTINIYTQFAFEDQQNAVDQLPDIEEVG